MACGTSDGGVELRALPSLEFVAGMELADGKGWGTDGSGVGMGSHNGRSSRAASLTGGSNCLNAGPALPRLEALCPAPTTARQGPGMRAGTSATSGGPVRLVAGLGDAGAAVLRLDVVGRDGGALSVGGMGRGVVPPSLPMSAGRTHVGASGGISFGGTGSGSGAAGGAS